MQALEAHSKAARSHITACDEWIKSHGKIDPMNWIDCFLEVLKAFEPTHANIEALLTHIIQEGQVKPCSHCGRIAGRLKDVNGVSLDLCQECQGHILYQELGPQEGYV